MAEHSTSRGDDQVGLDEAMRLMEKMQKLFFFFSSRRRHTRFDCDWSSDVCSSDLVKAGTDFVVYDAKTGEEITRSVLTQIIFEEESKGTNLLPINFLRQLIRFY